MGIARRRFTGQVLRIAAVLAVPASNLPARWNPSRRDARRRSRVVSIPVKRLSADEIKKPGRWRG
jgi:hypothetical protein